MTANHSALSAALPNSVSFLLWCRLLISSTFFPQCTFSSRSTTNFCSCSFVCVTASCVRASSSTANANSDSNSHTWASKSRGEMVSPRQIGSKKLFLSSDSHGVPFNFFTSLASFPIYIKGENQTKMQKRQYKEHQPALRYSFWDSSSLSSLTATTPSTMEAFNSGK